MSLETVIQDALNSCASGGAHQDVAPDSTAAPFIVWSQVISTTNNTLDGASDLQNTRIQVDVHAKSPTSRTTIAKAVTTAMAGLSLQNVQLTGQNTYEAEVKIFRSTLDFSVWST